MGVARYQLVLAGRLWLVLPLAHDQLEDSAPKLWCQQSYYIWLLQSAPDQWPERVDQIEFPSQTCLLTGLLYQQMAASYSYLHLIEVWHLVLVLVEAVQGPSQSWQTAT